MTEYARDTFTRTRTGSLGTAEVGGAWADALDSGWSVNVSGSNTQHTIGATTQGRTAHRLASSQPHTAVHGYMRARGGTETGGPTVTARLLLRSSGNTNAQTCYAFTVGQGPGFALLADVRVITNDNVGPAIMTKTVAGTMQAGEWWAVEAELIGANPTRVRARWWRVADGPPVDDTGWQEINDSTGPQGAGVLGLRAGRGTGSGTPALTVRIDDVHAADPMVASFVATPDAVDGLLYRFDPSTSTGDPVGWSWDFGDATPVSIEKSPSHHYAAAGTYNVKLTLTTRWGTRRSITTPVVVSGAPATPPEDVRPDVFLDGENVCDRIYSLAWKVGRDRWPDDVSGSAVTLQLRGRFPDVTMGSHVVIQLPPGAPAGTLQLWTGEVDTVDEDVTPVDAETTTTIVAMDVLSFLGRWHILPDTTIDEQSLPGRLADLRPRAGITYRQKWAGVPSARWPLLRALSSSADNLRQKTYLDLIRDAMRANIAVAHVARDGAIEYAPIDPPAGLTPPVLDLDAVGPDCPARVVVARSTPDGLVNRWTAGTEDRVDRSSIEAYGETSWTVAAGVLKSDATFPVSDAIANGMRDPFPGARVVIPVRDWTAKSYLSQPLDMASLQGALYGILGIGHRVTLDGWEVELSLDRDPWTLTGTVPPVTPPVVKTRTQTFAVSKDALLASPNMGAGKSTRNAVGLWSGTKFRMLVQFDMSYASKPTKITSAKLRLWTAGQDMCGYGATPQVHVDRVTGSWSEGSYGGGGPPWVYSTTNAVVYPGPSCTSTGRRSANVPSGEQQLVELDITAIVSSWQQGSANKGVRVISQNESSTSRTTEFHTSESPTTSRRPQLVVTYQYAG